MAKTTFQAKNQRRFFSSYRQIKLLVWSDPQPGGQSRKPERLIHKTLVSV